MPVFHSSYNEYEISRSFGNFALLPLKTKTRGPAPSFNPSENFPEDIVDEAITLFRANCFFRNFEFQGNADRVLVYCLLFISECLQKISGKPEPSLSEATKMLNALALNNFALPGDGNFPLNAMYEKGNDVDGLKQYMSQLRQEIASRLVEKVYGAQYSDSDGGKRPSKWWTSFQKRKFMNKSL